MWSTNRISKDGGNQQGNGEEKEVEEKDRAVQTVETTIALHLTKKT